MQMLHLKTVHHFLHARQELMCLLMKQIIFTLQCLCKNSLNIAIIIQMHGLWQFKRDEVPNDNADLTADNSQSFKYKAALVGITADAVNNTNSSVKSTKLVSH